MWDVAAPAESESWSASATLPLYAPVMAAAAPLRCHSESEPAFPLTTVFPSATVALAPMWSCVMKQVVLGSGWGAH